MPFFGGGGGAVIGEPEQLFAVAVTVYTTVPWVSRLFTKTWLRHAPVPFCAPEIPLLATTVQLKLAPATGVVKQMEAVSLEQMMGCCMVAVT